ncbi:MAG: flavin-containing monooxygenase, partial [Thalassolituus sp.]
MKQHNIVIIGSGFGGQSAAINLLKQGRKDFVILERRSFMGGTWCQNTYPGAAVDVQSPLYSISHEPYDWSQMYANQAELNEYTEHVLSKYNLRDKTDTNCNVQKVEWQDDISRWHIHTDNGEVYESQFIINASGPLSTPVIPNFKGRDTFKGKSFHTNDWDHDYDYKGKKVAIIGSGASAAQIIPAIAPDCGELHVFQRTPHWVMPRHDKVFKPWQRALLRNK